MRIQVDMFAVGLGAAVLLQFETPSGPVRVLADAGEARHKVNDRLPPAISAFNDDKQLRIDLMIGTHYDSDHLAGLVAVIKNSDVTIGEAWLPPVANDTDIHTVGAQPDDINLLALQFASNNGPEVLRRYLQNKADVCNRLAAAERRGDRFQRIERDPLPEQFSTFNLQEGHFDRDNVDESLFRAHIADANRTIGIVDNGHADESITDPSTMIEDASNFANSSFVLWPRLSPDLTIESLSSRWSDQPDRIPIEARTLALIRKSTAREAITASHLNRVVTALKARSIPIRCATIPDGQPRRFYWNTASARFTPVQGNSGGPELLLLGPSDGLVKKHWDKLPIGTYAFMAARALLPIEPITPSNQLSYIMAFEHANQRLLITGDAGCVDFKPDSRKPYFSDLIDALAPLHVVQVAHHAGHNAHFYRCLLASKFPTQQPASYLLLSHGIDDPKRPSDVFNKFMGALGKTEDEIKLLFTSRPIEAKVRDVKSMIAPVVGGPARSDGDIRLEFNHASWEITKHAVRVP